MENKKVGFSEQLLSPRRKVVSRFGFGVVVSVVVFISVVVLSKSFRGPFASLNFQAIQVSNSSWPFSFSRENVSRFDADGGSTLNVVKNVENSSSVVEDSNALLRNLSVVQKNVSSADDVSLKLPVVKNVIKEATVNVSNPSGGNNSLTENLDGGEVGNADVGKRNIGNLLYNGGNLSFLGGKSAAFKSLNDDSSITNMASDSLVECDIFDGRWVRDDSEPYYPPGSCPHIDRDFDCHSNGRPDDGYLRWKWQPYRCNIPSLNATDFLEKLRGKKLVFVGDSLNRNMWESLVCILRHSVKHKKQVYEISGKTEFKKNGIYAFRFEDYDCTVDFVSSPFLVRESSFKGKNGTFETLRLDLMDRTTSMYHDADIIIFNTGHWWTHEKTSRGEDYYQEGNYVYPRLKVLKAYKRALVTWARWIDKNIDRNRTQVFFRGYSVTHFRNGIAAYLFQWNTGSHLAKAPNSYHHCLSHGYGAQVDRGGPWNSGGQCDKEVEPIFNRTYLGKYPTKMRALDYVLQEMKTPVLYLNISRLTDYRKDGHPSIYRTEYMTKKDRTNEIVQDCSHWCLPGVPDTWNELLYASLLKAGKGSWGKLS